MCTFGKRFLAANEKQKLAHNDEIEHSMNNNTQSNTYVWTKNQPWIRHIPRDCRHCVNNKRVHIKIVLDQSINQSPRLNCNPIAMEWVSERVRAYPRTKSLSFFPDVRMRCCASSSVISSVYVLLIRVILSFLRIPARNAYPLRRT